MTFEEWFGDREMGDQKEFELCQWAWSDALHYGQSDELARLRRQLAERDAILRAVTDGVRGQWSDADGCWIAVDADAIVRVRAALGEK